MRFSTQIRRASDPNTLAPVIVYADELRVSFSQSNGSPSTECQLRVKAYSDPGVDGTPDAPDAPWMALDFERIFEATPPQLLAVDQRLRGVGNMMAAIRTFSKNQVDAHNENVLPGGTAAVHTDLDDDDPS